MAVEVIDLHSTSQDGIPPFDLSKQILDGLSRPAGQKEMPTMLLYDEKGLRLYDEITTAAPEYYLFGAEEEILKTHADEIVQTMHRGRRDRGPPSEEVVLELGAGALRKTSHILLGLSRHVEESCDRCPITYYALDLEKRELERTLGEIETSDVGRHLHGKVATKGMWGTYDDGLKYVEDGGLQNYSNSRYTAAFVDGFRASGGSPVSSGSSEANDSGSEPVSTELSSPSGLQPELHIMFLGSSIGNFSREGAAPFLRSLPLRAGAGDTLLLGLDHDNDKGKIEAAYNDSKGCTKRFIMNGLKHAGRVLGDEHMFDEDKWEYISNYNPETRKHEAFFKSKCSQRVIDPTNKREFSFLEDELLKIEESVKYSEVDAFTLFTNSNLRPIQRWTDTRSEYSLWLLERPPFSFPLLRSPSSPVATSVQAQSPFSFPSRSEWEDIWQLWNSITLGMIPPSMLHDKPIDLRHICLFYLGHIPTFLDIHLSRLLNEPHTEPEEYKYIFERGIDPDVEDPTQCHPHSEVPDKAEDWPTHNAILQFQARVRARLHRLYDDLESGSIAFTRKMARVLFMTLEHEALHAETLLYMLIQRAGSGTRPPSGFTPPHWESLAQIWDAAPAPEQKILQLGPATVSLGHDDDEESDTSADPQDIPLHEFGWDNENPKREVQVKKFAIEWRPITNGEFYQFYLGEGKEKVEFPASWVEEDGVVKVRTLYGPVDMKIAHHWPIITCYNNLSTYATVKGGRLPTEPELRLFYDKFAAGYEGGSNVGFRNWHPVPATTGLSRAQGKGTNGGVWEWTSTTLGEVDGFKPSKLYPGYTMDFFDDKHQVVLGGSFATIPRISERRTFRNWYQRNYAYAWVGGRVVYDISEKN